MRTFINHENVVRYRKLIMIAEGDPSRNEARYQTLLRLLAEEEAKEVPLSIGRLPHVQPISGHERFAGNARPLFTDAK